MSTLVLKHLLIPSLLQRSISSTVRLTLYWKFTTAVMAVLAGICVAAPPSTWDQEI